MDIFTLSASAPSPQFLQLAWGFRAARIVQVAVRLRLFTMLESRPVDAASLARRLQCDPAMTERLLIALASLDLVQGDADLWRNTLPTSLYLVDDKPLYQGDAVELAAAWWERYHHLEEYVRHGRSGDEEPLLPPTAWWNALHAMAIAGQAQRLARLVPLTGRRTLLDVGGAPGTMSIALAQRFGSLRITLLDHQEATDRSKAVVAQFGVDKQVKVKAADWRTRPFGKQEYEAVLLSRLAVGDDSRTLNQLVRAHDALKANGLLIFHSHLLDNDLNGGGESVYQQLMEEAYTLEQLCSMVEEAGFTRVTVLHRHPTDGDIIIGYKQDDSVLEEPQELTEFASVEQEMYALVGAEEEDNLLATHRRAWSGVIERLN